GELATFLVAGADRYGNPVAPPAASVQMLLPNGSGMHDACAELGGFSACVRVTVLPAELETITVSGPASMVANTTATFARVGADRFGNPIALTPSSFAFTAPTFAAPRDVCTSEGNVSGCLRVSVTPDALASLYLHGPASLVAGTNVTYEVRGFDRYENRVPVSTPTFTYEVPTSAGPARACVEVDALSTCRDVTVVADALTVVLVSGPSQLVANATASYDASGRDRFGNVVSTATFTFRAPTRAGDAQACTLLGGIEGCRTVSIVPDVVASVVVTGPSIVPAGATARFAVAASDAHGNAVDVGLVAFDQAAPTLAGPATACFTAGSVTGCAAYEVVAGALARLSLAAPARMVVGASAAPTAAGFDAHNNSVPVAPAWSASCGSFAGSAYVAPTSVGSCVLTATDRGVSASATVSILAGALQTLRIANGDIDRSADDRTPIVLSIAARDVHGNPIDVPASSLVWHGADVVNGVLQPIEAAGTRTLTARDPATNVSASINVTTRAGGLARIELSPPSVKVVENRSATFTTAYFDAQGNRLPTPAVFWQLDPIGVASFDARTATATGVSRGIATLTVRDLAGRVSANATIEVVSAAEAVVQATIIVPPPREGRNGLSAGEPFVFRVEAFDAAGVPIEGLVVTYTVEDPEIGTISADGVFTGNRVGTTGITARVGSVVARAVVTVVPGEPAMLRISPDSASRTLGGSIQLSAIGMDARRNVIPDLPITWSVNDSTMGSITPEGLYTAGAAVGASLVRASTVTTSGIVVYREAAIYQFISETRAPAGVDTVLAAVNLEAAVADVVTTTHVVGLAEVAPGALLDLSLPQSGPGTSALGTARVEIERAATDVTVMIEVQPASQFVLPEEVDRAMHETRIGDGRDQAPALYITVTATEDGRRLDSTQLNSLLRRLDITFHVEASYFTANNLDPNEVRLIEWSDGVLINANVPARLLTPEPVGGYYTYAATLMEFSSFAFVAKPLAAPAATTPAAPLPPTSAPAAPPLARILIAGPRTVVAGTTATYVLTGVAVDGTARTLAQGLLVSTFTQAGDAVLQYGEQGVVGAIRVTVLPGAAQTAVAENGTRVFAGSKGGIRLIGTDEFGNRVDLGWHAVEFTRAGTHTMTLVKDGLTVDATVEIVPNFLHEIRILGPDTLVAGTEATFTLAGFDAHGNPVALGESTLHVQAPNLMGPVEVFYEEGAVRGSKIVQVLAGKLARIEVRGVEVLRENATELYSLVGYDAGGNVVPLSRDVLEFVAPAGSHTTYVCFAEADVTGCLTVLVEREIEVHGDRGDGDGKAPFGVIGFALTLLGLVLCVVGLASILGVWRRRRSDEQEK
ncbi:MAG TPA: hypothetical protein VFH78_05705, partial [Candidatus Thermoplasmatota archaeon]|nr:hypothetical protein [Candidatus Thermoplasmatota archaeon]